MKSDEDDEQDVGEGGRQSPSKAGLVKGGGEETGRGFGQAPLYMSNEQPNVH